MKKILLTLTGCLMLTSAFSQKTEMSVGINSGLFSTTGNGAENTSFLLISTQPALSYTNNPYGSRKALSYGAEASIQRVMKNHFLFGSGFSFEVLRSKTAIDNVSVSQPAGPPVSYTASGRTFLNYSFINFNPFVGYRVNAGGTSLDVIGGLDVAFCNNLREHGSAVTADGTAYKTSRERHPTATDLRPRVQFTAGYKKLGVFTGYAFGLTNYTKDMIGGPLRTVNSRILRFGVKYQVN